MKKLKQVLPQTEMIFWKDTAHHPQAEHPQRFCNLLLEPTSWQQNLAGGVKTTLQRAGASIIGK